MPLAYCPSVVLSFLTVKAQDPAGAHVAPGVLFPSRLGLACGVSLGLHKPVTPDDLPSPAGPQSPTYGAYAISGEPGLSTTHMRWAQLLPGKLIPTPAPPILIDFSFNPFPS